MKVQASEELGHAKKIYEFIYDRGMGELPAIEKPKCEWESPLRAFEDAYGMKYSSQRASILYLILQKKKRLATKEFLQWFVSKLRKSYKLNCQES